MPQPTRLVPLRWVLISPELLPLSTVAPFILRIMMAIAISGFLFGFYTQAHANSSLELPAVTNSSTAERVYESSAKAVVTMQIPTADGTATGAGVIIDANGLVLTSAHVLNGAQRIRVAVADPNDVSNLSLIHI